MDNRMIMDLLSDLIGIEEPIVYVEIIRRDEPTFVSCLGQTLTNVVATTVIEARTKTSTGAIMIKASAEILTRQIPATWIVGVRLSVPNPIEWVNAVGAAAAQDLRDAYAQYWSEQAEYVKSHPGFNRLPRPRSTALGRARDEDYANDW